MQRRIPHSDIVAAVFVVAAPAAVVVSFQMSFVVYSMTFLNLIFDLIESEEVVESQEAVEVVPQTDS